MIDPDFSCFLDEALPGGTRNVISMGNNVVVRSISPAGDFVAKKIVDTDIPADYLIRINSEMSRFLEVQKTRSSFNALGSVYVISDFIPGVNLSSYLEQARTDEELDSVGDYLTTFCEASRFLTPFTNGFALFKNGAPTFETHLEFLQFYAKKYWGRVRDTLPNERLRQWLEHWVEVQIGEATLDDQYRTVSIDSNMRNFMFQADGGITLLNIPIVGFSTQSHAVAALSVHLRNTALHRLFLSKVETSLSPAARRAVIHLELWNILGIMSFYAARDPGGVANWRNWGSSVPLLQDIENVAQSLGYLSQGYGEHQADKLNI